MKKLIINPNAADYFINDLGLNISANSTFTIQPSDYPDHAQSSDIVTAINTGKVIINNGVANLSIADGISYIQNGSCANSRFLLQMGYNGTPAIGTFLQCMLGISSSTSPFVAAEPCLLKAWSFSGTATGTVTYDILINGTMVTQAVITSNNIASSYQLAIAINIKDKISAKVSASTLAIANPILNFFIETNN